MKHNCPVCETKLTHKGYSPRKNGTSIRRWHCPQCKKTYGENKLWYPQPVMDEKIKRGECLCEAQVISIRAEKDRALKILKYYMQENNDLHQRLIRANKQR